MLQLEELGIDLKQNRSIMARLFIFLTGFVVFIITILFFVQTVFLDDFYRIIKQNQIKKTANYLLENFDYDIYYSSNDFEYEDICIHLISSDGTILFTSEKFKNCPVLQMSPEKLSEMYIELEQNENNESSSITHEQKRRYNFDEPSRQPYEPTNFKMLMYSKVSSQDKIMVVAHSTLTPMNSTRSVLRVQILYVTLLLILSAGILAYILSRKIAQPIIDINRHAKKLIGGEYNLELDKSSYLEVEELNNTMKQTSVALKKVDAMQKELLSNVSHDLKTPLTMIIGYAEAIRDLPDENTPENLQVIIDEAQRLNRLVNDILELSKTNSIELKISNFDITILTKKIIDRCNILTNFDGYTFDFVANENITIFADENKISQVIYNLLGNAISHTGEDKKIKVIQDRILRDSKHFVKLSILDTGDGIPKEHLSDIWDRYYRVEKNHVRAKVGFGLGLSIVKNIVKQHNGRYGVESQEGVGSNFWIELSLEHTV